MLGLAVLDAFILWRLPQTPSGRMIAADLATAGLLMGGGLEEVPDILISALALIMLASIINWLGMPPVIGKGNHR